ncbi:MAG: thioredoxin reductase [Patescibacteria group bacterium]|nr:MAG: thioredoxin reductase [Patescibacteria group bacterium]
MKNKSVGIIGGGPAGLTAGLYVVRAGFKTTIFAGSPSGGQLMLTSEVENFPGFKSILGPELIAKIRDQANHFGADIKDKNIVQVFFDQKPFVLIDNDSVKYYFDAVIVAVGAKAMWLNLESEQRLIGKGVSACAVCDGFFFKNKTVAVVGGGDTAMEEALTLTKFAKKVFIIHRRDKFRASQIMQDRVFGNDKIEIIWNSEVKEVLGKDRVEGVVLSQNKLDGKISEHQLSVDGLFIAIGHKPDTEIFKDQIELDSKGYIINTDRLSYEILLSQQGNAMIEEPRLKRLISIWSAGQFNYKTATSVKGVFSAGDCVDFIYRQASTAVGLGAMSALDAEKFLENN